MSIIREAAGDLIGADEAILKAQAIAPDNADIQGRAASLAFARGERELATERSRQLQAQLPEEGGDSLEALFGLAQSNIIDGQYREAAHLLERMARLNPTDPRVWTWTKMVIKRAKQQRPYRLSDTMLLGLVFLSIAAPILVQGWIVPISDETVTLILMAFVALLAGIYTRRNMRDMKWMEANEPQILEYRNAIMAIRRQPLTSPPLHTGRRH